MNNRKLYTLFKEGEIKGINYAPKYIPKMGNLNITMISNFIYILY